MSCPSSEQLFARPELRESEHVLSCPRCNARLRALEEFLHPSTVFEAPAPAEIEQELRRRLAVDIRGRGMRVMLPRSRWRPRVLPVALASAAVVILAALWWQPFDRDERGALRSTAPSAASKLHLSEASNWNGSSLQVNWNPIEGAERYRVLVYDAELREIAAQDVVGAEQCSFGLAAADANAIWVRIQALRSGGLLEDSGLQLISRRP